MDVLNKLTGDMTCLSAALMLCKMFIDATSCIAHATKHATTKWNTMNSRFGGGNPWVVVTGRCRILLRGMVPVVDKYQVQAGIGPLSPMLKPRIGRVWTPGLPQ